MKSTIQRNMKISEIADVLKSHGIDTAYGWQIVLWGVFNSFETDELIVEGIGAFATLRAPSKEEVTQ